ncbi:TetR/AcrR family transcriptional regulator [Streptomyces sp. CG1]|uniref:TetR/AcrR family transcriptional regulator n=1 Tax=Streptomyces sp. CG1 TaxID=1287523 RepID=UPI0034E2235C
MEPLETQGADAFSMRGLATALNIKSPSLYCHVRSKEELFDLVIEQSVSHREA